MATLFTITKIGKQHKCPLPDDQIKMHNAENKEQQICDLNFKWNLNEPQSQKDRTKRCLPNTKGWENGKKLACCCLVMWSEYILK